MVCYVRSEICIVEKFIALSLTIREAKGIFHGLEAFEFGLGGIVQLEMDLALFVVCEGTRSRAVSI